MTALTMGREMANSRHSETLTFYIDHGVVIDPDTLSETHSTTELHVVAGRIKYPTSTVSQSSAVGQSFAEQDVLAKVAVGAAPNVRADHFCRVDASTADTGLIGRVYRVKGSAQAGQVTEHRFPLEEQS